MGHIADLADHSRTPTLPVEIARGLTARQVSFVYAYIGGQNAAEAARVAGYPEVTARNASYHVLRQPGVKNAIAWLLEHLEAQQKLDVPWVLERLRELHATTTAAVPVLDRRGQPTGEYKIDGPTAARSLELIGKHMGMFDQRVTVTHKSEIHLLLEQVAARGKPTLEQRHAKTIGGKVERMPVEKQRDSKD